MQEQLCAETFDEKARAESEFFGYVAQAYRHFLAGDDDECARVEQQQLGAFQEKMQATRARSEQLQQVGRSPPAPALCAQLC